MRVELDNDGIKAPLDNINRNPIVNNPKESQLEDLLKWILLLLLLSLIFTKVFSVFFVFFYILN